MLQVVGGSESSSPLIYTRSQTAEVAAGGWGRQMGGGPARPRMSHPCLTLSARKKNARAAPQQQNTQKWQKWFKKKNPESNICDSFQSRRQKYLKEKLPLQMPTPGRRWRLRLLTHDTAQGQDGGGWVGDEKMNKKWQAVRRETPLWEACQLSVAGSLARLPPYGGRRWNAGVRAPGAPDAQPDLDSQLREIPLVGRSKLVRATPTDNNRYKVFSRVGLYSRCWYRSDTK